MEEPGEERDRTSDHRRTARLAIAAVTSVLAAAACHRSPRLPCLPGRYFGPDDVAALKACAAPAR